MGVGTVVLSLSVFVVAQLIQGVVLDSYLFSKVREDGEDDSQWAWLVADGVLLLFGVSWIILHYNEAAKKDVFGIIPPLPLFWALYLLLCLIPRTSWLFAAAGTRIDCKFDNFSLPLDVLQSPVRLDLGANTLVAVLALFTTTMMVALATAGYGQHGYRYAGALDIDMAEAALSLVDGVEFLQAFFDVSNCQSKMEPAQFRNESNNMNENFTMVTTTTPAREIVCIPESNQAEHIAQCYLQAIEGTLGNLIIATACMCFALPVFALWQMRRRSDIQRLKKDLNRKRVHRRSSALGDATTMSTSSQIDLGAGSQIMLTVPNLETSTDGRSELGSDESRRAEKGKQQLKRWKLQLDVFQLIYLLWDCFLINMAGAVLRLYIWIQYKQHISALLTKNVLVVIFRLNALLSGYVQPHCKGRCASDVDDANDDDEIRVEVPSVARRLSSDPGTPNLQRPGSPPSP